MEERGSREGCGTGGTFIRCCADFNGALTKGKAEELRAAPQDNRVRILMAEVRPLLYLCH